MRSKKAVRRFEGFTVPNAENKRRSGIAEPNKQEAEQAAHGDADESV
jgi:hypothetical protein